MPRKGYKRQPGRGPGMPERLEAHSLQYGPLSAPRHSRYGPYASTNYNSHSSVLSSRGQYLHVTAVDQVSKLSTGTSAARSPRRESASGKSASTLVHVQQTGLTNSRCAQRGCRERTSVLGSSSLCERFVVRGSLGKSS